MPKRSNGHGPFETQFCGGLCYQWTVQSFEVSIDPFYSSSNMEYLEKITSDIDSGKVKVTEHQLIEVE